jgi:hypothetical protein
MTGHDLPDFDIRIIERYVENTYRKAAAVFLGSVVAGVMIGAVFGAIPLTSLGESWPIPRMFGFATMILGSVLGGVTGYLIGDTRAFLARLQGQTALAQLHAAKDARLALDAIREIQTLAARRAASRPAAPVAPPVEAEAAVAPAQVVQAPVVAAVPVAVPVVQAVPDPLPVPAEVEAAPPVTAVPAQPPLESAPAPLEAVPAPPPEPAPAPPTLVVAASAEPAPPAPPLSS